MKLFSPLTILFCLSLGYFSGFSYFLSLFGRWFADSIFGRFHAIFGSVLFYNIGNAGIVVIAYIMKKENYDYYPHFFIISLIFISLGASGMKANISTFAARQVIHFGDIHVRKLFNRFYWLINFAAVISCTFVAYLQLQDFLYGYLPGLCGTVLATIIFICSKRYFVIKRSNGSHLTDIFNIVTQSIKRKYKFQKSISEEIPKHTTLDLLEYGHIMFGGSYSTDQIDIVRSFSRILLIFMTLLVYWTIYFQMPSVFFFQSHFFDLKIRGFQIPASAMNLFDTFSILLMIQIMEHLVYPFFQYVNIHLTTLRRMGFGFFLVTLSMVYAALIEPYRRQNVDFQNTNIIMNTTFHCSNYTVLWQAPQFVLIGFSEFFTSISGLEFAYSQSPRYLQGIVMSLFLTTSGLGAFLGALIVKLTSVYKKEWLCENINKCSLEYYYYLLAGLSLLNLLIFMVVSKNFSYSVPFIGTISHSRSSRSLATPTDISDITDLASDANGVSSRIDLSRQSSFEDVDSISRSSND
eukprot:TCONS_00064039-protein